MKTFGKILARRLAVSMTLFICVAILSVGYFSSHATLPSERSVDSDAYAKSIPEKIVEEHGCWNGPAPKDVVYPGHVVIRMVGMDGAKYLGPKYVEIALNHLFTKPNPKVAAVYGFCR